MHPTTCIRTPAIVLSEPSSSTQLTGSASTPFLRRDDELDHPSDQQQPPQLHGSCSTASLATAPRGTSSSSIHRPQSAPFASRTKTIDGRAIPVQISSPYLPPAASSPYLQSGVPPDHASRFRLKRAASASTYSHPRTRASSAASSRQRPASAASVASITTNDLRIGSFTRDAVPPRPPPRPPRPPVPQPRAPSIPARTPTVEDGPPEEKRSLSNLYLNPPPDEDDDIYNESDSDEEGGEEEGWDEEGRRPRSPLRLSKDYTFGYEEEEGGGDGGGVDADAAAAADHAGGDEEVDERPQTPGGTLIRAAAPMHAHHPLSDESGGTASRRSSKDSMQAAADSRRSSNAPLPPRAAAPPAPPPSFAPPSFAERADPDDAVPTADEVHRAFTALSKLALFNGWRKYSLQMLCRSMRKRELKRYELLYRQGQPANCFYVVLKGAVSLEIDTTNGSTTGPPAAATDPRKPALGEEGGLMQPDGRAQCAHMVRPLYDQALGRSIGYDVSVYEDALLGPPSIFGTESLAQLTYLAPSAAESSKYKYLPYLHTATTVEAHTTLLVLPHSLLNVPRDDGQPPLATQLEEYGTRRRAELCLQQMALARTPIFASQAHLRLVQLSQHFTLTIYEQGDRIIEEGKKVDAFCIVLHGRLVVSQRTAWGKMRFKLGGGASTLGGFGAGKQSEVIVQTITHESRMPFVGEPALYVGHHENRPGAQSEISGTTVRAAEKTSVLRLPRDASARLSYDMPQFLDMLIQRRHLLMQNSMHAVALQHAIEKHTADKAHPSKELQEALKLARKANIQYNSKRLKEFVSNAPPPHPHSPMRAQRGKAAEHARKTLAQGMDVYSVATRMGLARRAGELALAESGKKDPAKEASKDGATSPTGQKRGPRRTTKEGIASRAQAIMDGEELKQGGGGGGGENNTEQGGRFLDAIAELQAARRVLDQAPLEL